MQAEPGREPSAFLRLQLGAILPGRRVGLLSKHFLVFLLDLCQCRISLELYVSGPASPASFVIVVVIFRLVSVILGMMVLHVGAGKCSLCSNRALIQEPGKNVWIC